MKLQFTRARITSGLGAVVLSAGLLAGPATMAQAEVAHQPSDADFANCPRIPAGALPLLWNCVSIVVVGGEMKLGSLKQSLSKPVKITVAMGPKDGKLQLVTGGISSEPIPIPPESLPVSLPGLSVQVEEAGPIVPGTILPESIPLKIHVIHALVGDNCHIGTNAGPLSVKPNLSGLKLDTLGGVRVLRTTIGDDTFAVPAASGCKLGIIDLSGIINLMAGLPSASGKNSVSMDAVIRIKNYRLGQITTNVAKDNKIK